MTVRTFGPSVGEAEIEGSNSIDIVLTDDVPRGNPTLARYLFAVIAQEEEAGFTPTAGYPELYPDIYDAIPAATPYGISNQPKGPVLGPQNNICLADESDRCVRLHGYAYQVFNTLHAGDTVTVALDNPDAPVLDWLAVRLHSNVGFYGVVPGYDTEPWQGTAVGVLNEELFGGAAGVGFGPPTWDLEPPAGADSFTQFHCFAVIGIPEDIGSSFINTPIESIIMKVWPTDAGPQITVDELGAFDRPGFGPHGTRLAYFEYDWDDEVVTKSVHFYRGDVSISSFEDVTGSARGTLNKLRKGVGAPYPGDLPGVDLAHVRFRAA